MKRKQGSLELFYGEGTDKVFKTGGHYGCMAKKYFYVDGGQRLENHLRYLRYSQKIIK